jgi:bifunctional non-homologous end joining protein LigD
LEEPDLLVFDLDPDEGMDLSKVREAVRDLKSLLDELDLTSFLKTSGGKGYHVVVPLKPSASWEDARTFSQNVAKAMEAKWPKKYTSNMRKEKRKGKVFVDWIRNGRGATSVAPYSLRARPGAPISCPIGWSELDTIGPADITLENIGSRSRKQPWRQFFSVSQRLTASMTKD